MSKKNVEVLIKVSSMTDPMGKPFINEAKNGRIETPILVMKNNLGKHYAYAETLDDSHRIGMITSVDGSTSSADFDDAFLGNYELRVTGIMQGGKNTLTAELVKDSVDAPTNDGVSEPKELSDLWEQKISAGIVTPEDRANITAVFDNHRVNNFDRMRCVSKYRIYNDINGKRIMVVKPAHVYVNPDVLGKENVYDWPTFAEALNAALNGQPMVYEGDKSTGKSVAAKTLAYVMQIPYWEDTYSEDMMRSDPIAERAFDDGAQKHMTREGAEAHMLWNADPDKYANYSSDAAEYIFWKDRAMTPQITTLLGEMGKWAMYGGLYVANEANLARINVRESLFNPAAEDNNPHMTIPGYGLVYLNKDCVLVATQNRDYAGTNGSNDAIDSRFGKLKFGYPPHIFDQLKSMTESDVGVGCLPDEFYKRCDKLYVFLRDQVHEGQRSNSVLSIRSFGKALKDVALGGGYVTLHSKLLIYLQNMTHTDEEDRAIADDIHQFIATL